MAGGVTQMSAKLKISHTTIVARMRFTIASLTHKDSEMTVTVKQKLDARKYARLVP